MAKLLERDLVGADFRRQVLRATPAHGTAFEEMLAPDYWAHVASRLNPYDIIEVVAEDGSFYARLIVLNKGKLWAKVQQLEYTSLVNTDKKDSNIIEQFEAKFQGRSGKWRAVRKSDGSAVANDIFESQQEAEEWIEKNAKDMAA